MSVGLVATKLPTRELKGVCERFIEASRAIERKGNIEQLIEKLNTRREDTEEWGALAKITPNDAVSFVWSSLIPRCFACSSFESGKYVLEYRTISSN